MTYRVQGVDTSISYGITTMNITEITYSRTAKINTGNYENQDISIGVVVQTDGGDPHVVFGQAKAWVDDRIKTNIKELKP